MGWENPRPEITCVYTPGALKFLLVGRPAEPSSQVSQRNATLGAANVGGENSAIHAIAIATGVMRTVFMGNLSSVGPVEECVEKDTLLSGRCKRHLLGRTPVAAMFPGHDRPPQTPLPPRLARSPRALRGGGAKRRLRPRSRRAVVPPPARSPCAGAARGLLRHRRARLRVGPARPRARRLRRRPRPRAARLGA